MIQTVLVLRQGSMFQKIESPLAKLEISYAETLFNVFF